jgi:hypothetical protein
MSKLDSKACPQPKTLSDFLLGKLDFESSQQCESHLAECEPCIETISGLNVNDTFQSLVANSGSVESTSESAADESIVSNLIHRLAEVGKTTGLVDTSHEQRAADVIALLSPPESADAIGQIDHYRIENVLGCGSTGVVFGATDETLDRPVAIKVLRPSLGDAARQRFIAEARATANLNHANIVTIFHVGVTGSVAYIVMQWLPGETLEQRLERESVLDSSAVKNYASQIAKGLAKAHEKGLIHRDIKPANLWITEDDHVKILDFGLVRIMDESPQLTCTGMIAGTPCFMSPEQSRGDELDARSDLFSLGCVIYRCLTGKLPFVSSNALATLQAIQRTAPESPKSLEPSVDQDLSDLAMSLLEKSPHRRPGSANEVALAIESPRNEWPFRYELASDSRDAAQTKSLPKPMPGSSGMESFWGRGLAALALGVIGFAAFAFWPQIIRIATNQGEIVIESNDPDVQIEVLDGGKQVEIIDLKTDQTIQIQAGTYQIRAIGEENSVSIDKETLTLSRGESEIVKVTKSLSANVKAAGLTSSLSTAPLNPTGEASTLRASANTALSSIDPMHRVSPGDVLGVFVERVTGMIEDFKGDRDYLGIPVVVRSDGTISIPLVDPISVKGMTALDIENAIRKSYTLKDVFVEGRSFHVCVVVRSVYQGAKVVDEARGFSRTATSQKQSTFEIASDNPQVPGLKGPVQVTYDSESASINVIGDAEDCKIVTKAVSRLSSEGETPPDLEQVLTKLANSGKLANRVYREPVYDGMTFDECLNAVKFERDAEKLEKPCIGLMELCDSKSSEAVNDKLLQAVFRIQKYNSNSPAIRRYVRWLSSTQFHDLAIEITASNDEQRWLLFHRYFLSEWKRLRPVEDNLISNIIDTVQKGNLGSEAAAGVLTAIIRQGQLSKTNANKTFECLTAYAKTAEYSEDYFETLVNSNPSRPGLGEAMCGPVSRSNQKEIEGWSIRVNRLSASNRKAVIKTFAKRTFEIPFNHTCVAYLSNLPEDLQLEIKPVVKEFVAAESKSAIAVDFAMTQRQSDERVSSGVEATSGIEQD